MCRTCYNSEYQIVSDANHWKYQHKTNANMVHLLTSLDTMRQICKYHLFVSVSQQINFSPIAYQ